ncbi:hypothetical protein J1N09_05280 [Aureitalea sp. L0-47]|uniref:hypothetical protein n=1 Tax=Aureitalea sp. L0-47 TaxID=2816962 RepID=UPI0022375C73|nr:hypothetical protein [Aureitalea sp. L0-47]MCW5519240.1 hypothetical protein [Aureitalea sp. L0-47]
MRFLLFCTAVLLLISCNSKVEEPVVSVVKPADMEVYVPSEMANHMNFMYEYNEELKNRILKGDTLGSYPEEFEILYSAKLTDPTDRDEFFELFSNHFIETQKIIYDEESEIPLEDRYNSAINLCISCHNTTCIGPIPRIKKLLIQ